MRCKEVRLVGLGHYKILVFEKFAEYVTYYENTTVQSDFRYAVDLVKFIKRNFGDYFSIAVAGYASCHPESKNKSSDLEFLKQKVNAYFS